VSDPEQAWILGELIRYLQHPASGAMDLDDMGANWPSTRDAAREGTLRRTDEQCREIAQRWERVVRFAALRLGSHVGVDVQPVIPRAHADPVARLNHLTETLATHGVLEGTLRIPGAAGDLVVTADLRARQITTTALLPAPTDRGSRARVTWLLRQLGADTPTDLVLEAYPRMARQPILASLSSAREDRDLLLDPDRREILRFAVVRRCEMGQNRKDGGRSPGFIQSVTNAIDNFYSGTVQQIVPWTARPPQARPTKPPTGATDRPIERTEDLDDAIGEARAAAGQTANETQTSAGSTEEPPDMVIDAPAPTTPVEV
jgi:hypothetical protein